MSEWSPLIRPLGKEHGELQAERDAVTHDAEGTAGRQPGDLHCPYAAHAVHIWFGASHAERNHNS